jgi:tRNA-specific 2-thiouridylase
MNRRCVVLLSGGLDSMLAIRLMQQQGVEVEGLNFKTVFTCCQDTSAQSARELGVRLTVIGQQDDYLDLVRNPRFGYGRGANPCVDCRIYMFEKAKHFMKEIGADFIVSGEVVGQRPMSQKRRDLLKIAYHSELEDLLLRPLSAKLLPPTRPEREGWIDREKLYGFSGRGRKELIVLAKQLGIRSLPTPSTGCALTEPGFSRKVFDLMEQPAATKRWDYELLKVGRHFRLDATTKVVLGRSEPENEQLEYLHSVSESASSALMIPDDFAGPCALMIGSAGENALRFAGGLILRYAQNKPVGTRTARLDTKDECRLVSIDSCTRANQAVTVGSP